MLISIYIQLDYIYVCVGSLLVIFFNWPLEKNLKIQKIRLSNQIRRMSLRTIESNISAAVQEKPNYHDEI